jgi:hypothetical protein
MASAITSRKEVIMGIGDFIRDRLAEEMSPEGILPLVKAKFPSARTTINSIRWYRSNPKNPQGKSSQPRPAMPKKYALPSFLEGVITQAAYVRWLSRKSIAHVRRDKKRGNTNALNEAYKKAIHLATSASGGLDEYTGEALDWHLVSTYDNDESKKYRRKYKSLFFLLPTIDHVDDGLGEPNFKICGWRTNDVKADLTHAELIAFCRCVLDHSSAEQQRR